MHGACARPRRRRRATKRQSPSRRARVALCMNANSAPKTHACSNALLGEPTTADPARETEVVADERARRRLSADPALVDDQGVEPLRGAVDRGRQPGRPGTDDDDVELAPLGVDRGAGPPRAPRCSGPRGPCRSGTPPGGARSLAGLRDQPAARRPSRRGERVRERAAPQDLAQLVGAAGPRLGDDVDGVRGTPRASAHSSSKPETDWWKSSSGDARRPHHVVVELPRAIARRSPCRSAVAPAAPLDQHPRWHAGGARAPCRGARSRSSRRATAPRGRARRPRPRPPATRASPSPPPPRPRR